MTKKEKKALLSQLLSKLPHGEGASRLADWCDVTASLIYQWMNPEGAWPRPPREARMWEYFGYAVDQRGNPVAPEPGYGPALSTENKRLEEKKGKEGKEGTLTLTAEQQASVVERYTQVEKRLKELAEHLATIGIHISVGGVGEGKKPK